MIPASGEIRRYRWQIGVRAHVQDQVHADEYVEEEVAVEQPVSGIIGTESENHVAVVRYGDGVLGRWQIELTIKETPLVQIQRVLQIDLFHVLVR